MELIMKKSVFVLCAVINLLAFCAPSPKLIASKTPLTYSTSQTAFIPTPTTTSTPTFSIGTTLVSLVDDMTLVYVPEGEFTMGLDIDTALAECQKNLSGCTRDWFLGAEPVHSVYLPAFWIDLTEVTNIQYAECVADGYCRKPSPSSRTRFRYYDDIYFLSYPVINVTWSDAQQYCDWAGRRLPTEAEWEKAARGTDGRLYPWGDTFPTCSMANFGSCVMDTSQVGNYQSGASPYGARDMAGNVWEWVADWYSDEYYSVSPASNPSGPASGEYRVARGGSWNTVEFDLLSSYRHGTSPTFFSDDIGFRCVQDMQP
jgi:formylglycine-generating enzyme required for sulfatase activity